ncbi:hypothetical protein [Lentilitoribacter sp. Alg239-R112]|uniref:hypothetical protein n=1 Tax=Lentilitoribacter sp. Alg239-R112 TaxID=2305987 RepID=UPI0013A6F6BE|nr:hypothetical protein [Lentilitoribacter sp. Alg239-R112]
MQDLNVDKEDEKPLDPEMEKVRRKMVRLLGVSLGIMFIGVMAVLAAVVYKINAAGDDEIANPAMQSEIPVMISNDLEVILPVGFTVVSFDLDGVRGAIMGTATDGKQHIFIVDLKSGEIISDILLRN